MSNKIEAKLEKIEVEVAALRDELRELKTGAQAIRKEVKASVSGPRLSEVFVEAQAIPLTGLYNRSGSRVVELSPPDIDVFVAVKGQKGTDTLLIIEINSVRKEERFRLEKEKEYKKYQYPFGDFNLEDSPLA
jgi:hypothetical protein